MIEKKRFEEINVNDSFFDSLRKNYPDFNAWFLQKRSEYAYVEQDGERIDGFLYLKIEKDDSYEDFMPSLQSGKLLKIGTLKVRKCGLGIGEHFMGIAQETAQTLAVDAIYVTFYPNGQDKLVHLLKKHSFFYHGKKTNGEVVYLYNC